jgi:hypothetical protein
MHLPVEAPVSRAEPTDGSVSRCHAQPQGSSGIPVRARPEVGAYANGRSSGPHPWASDLSQGGINHVDEHR